MIRLYLIRHGRQNSAKCNVNVPLSEAGIIQAELTGERLMRYNVGMLYSSKLIRAVDTAEIINNKLGIEHFIDERLNELSFGDLEGRDDFDIKEHYSEFLKEREKMTKDIPYPNGECGEDGYNRAMPAIKNILQKALNEKKDSVAIITHGGIIRSLLAGIIGDDFSKKLKFAKNLENCSITELNYYETTNSFTIERVNDYSHIEIDEKLLRKHFK